LLSAREDVDPARLAYIGYSYGAAMGGLLAGIEPRIKAFCLMVGDGGIVSHFTAADGTLLSELDRLPDEKSQAWLELMNPIEPIRFVGRAAPAASSSKMRCRMKLLHGMMHWPTRRQAANSNGSSGTNLVTSCLRKRSGVWSIGSGAKLASTQASLSAHELIRVFPYWQHQ
jgi:hypothetical protein